jgi:hypothetical protein
VLLNTVVSVVLGIAAGMMSVAYRFYVIGEGDRILVNELLSFADDAATHGPCQTLLTKTAGAKAVEVWERARLVHRVE